jgi:hypothetical protein
MKGILKYTQKCGSGTLLRRMMISIMNFGSDRGWRT